MCQQDQDSGQAPSAPQNGAAARKDEPWVHDIGTFDAHCHTTFTNASIASIPSMRARLITVMATRFEDQGFVAEAATRYGIREREALAASPDQGKTQCQVIPSFGWHPYFAYQLYDDTASNPTYQLPNEQDDSDIKMAAKRKHYNLILRPPPTEMDFVDSLPTPSPLSSFISSTRDQLSSHPLALVGEIGLDKGFRVPRQWDPSKKATRDESRTAGGREGSLLSPYRVNMPHQQAILSAQIDLAGEMGRAVSVHGVQAHGVLYDTIAKSWKGHEREVLSRRKKKINALQAATASNADVEEEKQEREQEQDPSRSEPKQKPFPPRICLHSFSGSTERIREWQHPAIPAEIFFSFSVAVNMSTDSGRSKIGDVIRRVKDNRILAESDLHTAGPEMDDALEEMYRVIAREKGWEIEECARNLRSNYEEFIFGVVPVEQ